ARRDRYERAGSPDRERADGRGRVDRPTLVLPRDLERVAPVPERAEQALLTVADGPPRRSTIPRQTAAIPAVPRLRKIGEGDRARVDLPLRARDDRRFRRRRRAQALEPRSQVGFDRGVRARAGDIDELWRVLGEVVELLLAVHVLDVRIPLH